MFSVAGFPPGGGWGRLRPRIFIHETEPSSDMSGGTHRDCFLDPARAASPALPAESPGGGNSRGRRSRIRVFPRCSVPRLRGHTRFAACPRGESCLGFAAATNRSPWWRWPRQPVPPRPTLFIREAKGVPAIMYCDRRFVITVSLIWAMLVSSAFYLLVRLSPPASPATRYVVSPRGQLELVNRAPPGWSGWATGCNRLRISP